MMTVTTIQTSVSYSKQEIKLLTDFFLNNKICTIFIEIKLHKRVGEEAENKISKPHGTARLFYISLP